LKRIKRGGGSFSLESKVYFGDSSEKREEGGRQTTGIFTQVMPMKKKEGKGKK